MKVQALEDCDQYIPSYTFTDTEYENDPIRIRIDAAAAAPEAQLVRCNILYAMKVVAINLMSRPRDRLYGARFNESFRGQLLYVGLLDNKNDVPLLEKSTNSLAGPNRTIAQGKRSLSTQALDATNSTMTTNSTMILLTIPGSNDIEYRIEFQMLYYLVPKRGIFSSILELMMILAQLDSDASIEQISQSTSTDSSWIFVTHNSESGFPLQAFQLAAILESIARYAVMKTRYVEMTFDFFGNEESIAWGCVTIPVRSREWCHGLRTSGGQDSLVHLGNISSTLGSDLIEAQ